MLDAHVVEAKLEEVKKELSADAKIDPQRLRQAVMDDLIQEQLMSWLEENSTLTERAATTASEDSEQKPAAKKKAASKKASDQSKSKADDDA